MEISMIQMLLVLLVACYQVWDQSNLSLTICGMKIIPAFLVGCILGNPMVGLKIGATIELMSLGVIPFGGSSVPDYPLGAIMGTVIAFMSGKGAEYGLMVGIPLSVLAIQLDVLSKTGTAFFVHQAEKCVPALETKKMCLWLWNGFTFWFLKYVIPIVILFAIGPNRMSDLMNMIPQWFIDSFSIAGGLLPIVGICVLLRFMNAKNYAAYILIGFGLSNFLNVPVIGIAVFGVAMGLIEFKRNEHDKGSVAVQGVDGAAGGMEDEL